VEVIKFIDLLERWLETLSGVNSVARGNPEASLKSGSALALVQAQALQFLALIQKAYIHFLEKVTTGTIKDYQEFGTAPHVITIVGKGKRQYVKEFVGADIDQVARVNIEVGNPLSGTIAGRVNLTEQLGNLGLIKSPQQFFQVMETGRMEPVTEGEQSELMLVRAENEDIAEGRAPSAFIFDNHPLHIREHLTPVASPEARQDPQVVQTATAHIQEHLQLWRQADPEALMMLGIQPSRMAQEVSANTGGTGSAGLAQGMGPQGPMMPGAESGAGGPQMAKPPQTGAPPDGAQMPRQPNMPKNALTGERAAPPVSGAPPALA
jgi:hypothetical protein